MVLGFATLENLPSHLLERVEKERQLELEEKERLERERNLCKV